LENTTETTGTRLGKFLNSQGIAYGQFEKKAGWSHGLAGKVIHKGVSFGVDKLERIFSEFPQLNLMWLITGEGDMLIQPGNHSGTHALTGEQKANGTPSPLPETVDLNITNLTGDEAQRPAKDVANALNPVHLVASLERLLVLIEHNPALPDADKKALLRPLHELRSHLFLSVNQVIASEAKYRAAMDAIKLLAAQLQAETAGSGKKK
jgi:hypothetical protein